MERSHWRLDGVALITGLLLVPARLFLSFFPFFNLGEIMLFAAAAAALAYYFRVRPSWWVVALFLPVFLFVLHIVIFWLGLSNLRQGIGVGHVVSLVLIPLSTLAGARYGSKIPSGSHRIQI